MALEEYLDPEVVLANIEAYVTRVSARNSVAYDSSRKAWQAETDAGKRAELLTFHEQVAVRLHEVNSILSVIRSQLACHKKAIAQAATP